jgi:hypothetical protein
LSVGLPRRQQKAERTMRVVPKQSGKLYRLLGLLIAGTVMVAPSTLALMLVIHASAAIFLGLLLAAFAVVFLAAAMADR